MHLRRLRRSPSDRSRQSGASRTGRGRALRQRLAWTRWHGFDLRMAWCLLSMVGWAVLEYTHCNRQIGPLRSSARAEGIADSVWRRAKGRGPPRACGNGPLVFEVLCRWPCLQDRTAVLGEQLVRSGAGGAVAGGLTNVVPPAGVPRCLRQRSQGSRYALTPRQATGLSRPCGSTPWGVVLA